MNHREAYARTADRIVALLDDDVADVEVATCPGWTVKDLVAHLAGFFTAYKSGDENAFGPDWGEREVEARKNRSLKECVDEWNYELSDPAGLFESPLAPVAVSDVLAHEQDIRSALDRPGARDDENIVPAVEMALSFIEKKADEAELPPLRIITEDLNRQLGAGAPGATLETSTFELFRAVHGRRTTAQLRAMKWEGESDPWLPALSIFGPPTKEKVED
jgi:uncharacterized protein (TIGR03083 family)